MREQVTLRVLVAGTLPPTYEDYVVETTATAGLYVSVHPDGLDGWVLLTQCGSWLANYVRWRTRDDAHQVAAALGHEGVDWTLPTKAELVRFHPDYGSIHWAVVERFGDRRHATSPLSR